MADLRRQSRLSWLRGPGLAVLLLLVLGPSAYAFSVALSLVPPDATASCPELLERHHRVLVFGEHTSCRSALRVYDAWKQRLGERAVPPAITRGPVGVDGSPTASTAIAVDSSR